MPKDSQSNMRKILIESMVEKLPEIRKELGFSQTKLALLLDKSRQTVSDIERKSYAMPWDTYLAIVKVMEIHGIVDKYLDIAEKTALKREILAY